jgi:hypothetical protein
MSLPTIVFFYLRISVIKNLNFKASTGRALERHDHIAMLYVSLYS